MMKMERIRKFCQLKLKKWEIFQVGTGAEINSAIFDVGYEYVGEQNVHIMNNNPDFSTLFTASRQKENIKILLPAHECK